VHPREFGSASVSSSKPARANFFLFFFSIDPDSRSTAERAAPLLSPLGGVERFSPVRSGGILGVAQLESSGRVTSVHAGVVLVEPFPRQLAGPLARFGDFYLFRELPFASGGSSLAFWISLSVRQVGFGLARFDDQFKSTIPRSFYPWAAFRGLGPLFSQTFQR